MTESQSLSCFLLNYSFRDFKGYFEISLYSITENREPVKIVIDNFRPLFFVPRSISEDLTRRAVQRKQLPLKAMDGTAVDCLYFRSHTSYLDCLRELRREGTILYESDIHPAERYLMERFVNGGFEARGPFIRENGTILMHNPQIRGTDISPKLKVMSIDIETQASTGRIYSIASHGTGDAVFIEGKGDSGDWIFYCQNEKDLLINFFKYLEKCDPDVIIGWNIVEFDLRTIQQRCKDLSVRFDMGRDTGSRIVQNADGTKWSVRIPGRVVMDVPLMLRANFHTFEEYSLNFVASEMLKETKEIELTGKEKIDEIDRRFNYDKLSLAKYNLKDAVLTKEIFDKAGILPNAIERSKRSGHLLDRTGGSIAAFDYLYLPRLHRKGYVAGDVSDVQSPSTPLPGGFVLEPVPGIYENVLVLDFRSLYPSIISTFKIDPLGYIVPSASPLRNPSGTLFSSDTFILPEIIDNLLEARAAAKKGNNPYLSQAIKILMNSFYGVLGAQGCRFFSAELASTITRTGQYIFKTTVSHISSSTPYKVIYGDTDSLFVLLGPGKELQADQIGKALSTEITTWLSEHLKSTFNVNSILKLEYQDHFRHFLMPAVRGAAHGSKKHYCGSILDESGFSLVFKGMESARSDWTDLAKEFQQELITRVFSGKPLDEYINDVVLKLKSGSVDNKLIYKKRLRKRVEEYTLNIPPHVQAAKQLDSPGHLIKYLITLEGPQPLQKISSGIDYTHYIDCQIKPVADSVLELIGTSFDKITSGQQDLFGS